MLSIEGAMSTTLDKTLPIGWNFCYGNIGISVDFELNYSRDRQTFSEMLQMI